MKLCKIYLPNVLRRRKKKPFRMKQPLPGPLQTPEVTPRAAESFRQVEEVVWRGYKAPYNAKILVRRNGNARFHSVVLIFWYEKVHFHSVALILQHEKVHFYSVVLIFWHEKVHFYSVISIFQNEKVPFSLRHIISEGRRKKFPNLRKPFYGQKSLSLHRQSAAGGSRSKHFRRRIVMETYAWTDNP